MKKDYMAVKVVMNDELQALIDEKMPFLEKRLKMKKSPSFLVFIIIGSYCITMRTLKRIG